MSVSVITAGANQNKYLKDILNKLANSSDEDSEQITKGRKVIGVINSLLWKKEIKRRKQGKR